MTPALFNRPAGLSLLVGLLLSACHSDSKTPAQVESNNTGSAVTATVPAAAEGYRRYTGQIGRLPVVVELYISDTTTTGTYYYQRRGQELSLRAVSAGAGQALVFRESVDGKVTGSWLVTQRSGPMLSGTWRSADGQRQLPFELSEDYRDAVRYDMEQFESSSRQLADSLGCGSAGDTVNVSLEIVAIHLLDANRNVVLQRVQQQLVPVPFPQLRAYVDKAVADGGDCSETEQTARVTYNADNLLSVSLFEQVFPAGAPHPTHSTTPLTFDLRTGRKLLLRDLLRPGYEQPLRQMLTKRLLADELFGEYFRAEQEDSSGRFDDWRDKQGNVHAPLPHNGYSLTPAGIEFEYGEYEITPYVIGPQTVLISYADLRCLVHPNGPLAAVLNRLK